MDDYLATARDKIDHAVAEAKSKATSDTKLDELLWEACKTACVTLQRLYDDAPRWKRITQGAGRNISVVAGQPIHFDEDTLPITADALERFGYKPPGKAKAFVSNLIAQCDTKSFKANTVDNQIKEAKEAVNTLRAKTCELADVIGRKPKNREWRRKWGMRIASLLGGVASLFAVAGGMSTALTAGEGIRDQIKHEICVLAPQGITSCANVALKQHEALAIGTVAQEPQSGTDVQKLQSGTDVQKLQSGTDVQKPQSGTDVQKPQSGTDVQKPQSGRVSVAVPVKTGASDALRNHRASSRQVQTSGATRTRSKGL